MRTPAGADLPDFVAPSDPATITVRRTGVSAIVIAASDRTRRIRAWVRFAAVTGLLAAALTSGAAQWWLVLPWFATVSLTVPHAYRDALAGWSHERWGSPSPRLVRLIGKYPLAPYSAVPKTNTPGILDLLGCLWGAVISGQLFAFAGLQLFDLNKLDQAGAAPAGGVLATIVLIGGAQIVTNSVSWQTVQVEHDRGYRQKWTGIAVIATVIVVLALWPGGPSSGPAYATRVAIEVGAAAATIFTCLFGRMSISRQIRQTEALLAGHRDAIRATDARKVHIAKARVTGTKVWLTAIGEADAASLLDDVTNELEILGHEMQANQLPRAETSVASNVSEIFNDFVAPFSARSLTPHEWEGVVRDLVLDDEDARRDAPFIYEVVSNLVSNAINQLAEEFSLAVYTELHEDFSTVVIEAVCKCQSRFDGTLPDGHGLDELRKPVQQLKGHFDIQEHAPPGANYGRHEFRIDWTTPHRLNETPPTRL